MAVTENLAPRKCKGSVVPISTLRPKASQHGDVTSYADIGEMIEEYGNLLVLGLNPPIHFSSH